MNYSVTDQGMRRKVERWLRENNNCYTFEDVLEAIEKGDYQSHVFGNTWVLTSIHKWPRKTSVHIDLVVGDLYEFLDELPKLYEWAKGVGADFITGSGRPGWNVPRRFPEWRLTGYMYAKDL